MIEKEKVDLSRLHDEWIPKKIKSYIHTVIRRYSNLFDKRHSVNQLSEKVNNMEKNIQSIQLGLNIYLSYGLTEIN